VTKHYVVSCPQEQISRTIFYSIQQQLIPGIIQYSQDIAGENRENMRHMPALPLAIHGTIIAIRQWILLM
jgi:hypothetical protein